jgi:ureidoglycolate dehydrogenase (NAD+)
VDSPLPGIRTVHYGYAGAAGQPETGGARGKGSDLEGPAFAEDVLQRLAADVLARAGMSARDAGCVADALIWAEQRGQGGHGLSRVPFYLELIDQGFLDPRAVPTLALDRAGLFVLEAHRAAGAVAMERASDLLAARAKEAGLAFGTVRNASHTGAIGRYAERLAARGLVAIIGVAGPPLMAYAGAAVASASTSPLAIAAPGAEAPVVLDMATSVVPFARLLQARRLGQPIPEGWALGPDGAPTTDPAAASVPLPLGGPKGAGLALMFEILAGLLAGNPILAPALASEESRAAARNGLQNAFLFAADVAAFRPLGDFRADVAALAAALKALPRQPGVEAILLPGERGAAAAARRRAEGVPLAPPLLRALTDAAARFGIAFPAPAAAQT